MTGCSVNIHEEFQKENIGNKRFEEPKAESSSEENINVEDEGNKIDLLKEEIKTMTLDEKIGQMLIVGLDGYILDDDIKRMIEDYYVGGIILFSRNVKNPNQLLGLMNSLKAANSKNNIPLFLSVDEEGGRVSRMPEEFIDIPSNRIIGQKNNDEFAYKIGRVIAEEIKSFGFNMNFAPVLDIDSNPHNPVIGDRSFGANKDIVGRLGVKTMKGLKSQEVIAVVKHFPGHGDTSVDSHIGLPKVDKDLNGLSQFEILPFKKAIENNVDAVMVAHILFSKIDSKNPATLSKLIVTDVLRKDLNFDGIVITDDMTMGAIIENYDIGNAAVKAVEAGSDIILVSHGYENKIKVLKDLKNAVGNERIPMERIDESVYRILKLKRKYKLKDDEIDAIDVEDINRKIRIILEEH